MKKRGVAFCNSNSLAKGSLCCLTVIQFNIVFESIVCQKKLPVQHAILNCLITGMSKFQ
uniref:Uncharacterized protein n=1 Tax=Rhizophora mucronata TaxID=61149 RepID=A0A2P2LB74_RHIMU